MLLSFGKIIMSQMKKNSKSKEKSGGGGFSISGFKFSPELLQMLGGFSILRASSMLGMVNVSLTKEQLLSINKKLNKIKKPKADNKEAK